MMLTLKNTIDMLAYRLTGLQAYRLTGLQAYRLTGLQAYRLTGLQAYRLVIPAYSRNIVVNNDVCED